MKEQLDETIRQTNQMLALARADSAELVPEALELRAFCAEVTRGWWPEARARDIDLGLDAERRRAADRAAHPGLLKEAMANLLHNAIRYTPPGGQVTVHVGAREGAARITVSDSGPGIPAAERPRAGERFFRASNAEPARLRPGSGHRALDRRAAWWQHGGRRPGRGQGLAVSIVLPLEE